MINSLPALALFRFRPDTFFWCLLRILCYFCIRFDLGLYINLIFKYFIYLLQGILHPFALLSSTWSCFSVVGGRFLWVLGIAHFIWVFSYFHLFASPFRMGNASLLCSLFANLLHAVQPVRVPSFAFAWLEVVSHRCLLPRLLLPLPLFACPTPSAAEHDKLDAAPLSMVTI